MSAAPEPGTSAPASAESIDIAALLRAALALHQRGRLAEAEGAYRRILAAQPRHFDSLHLLGVISSQRGEHAAAIRQIDAAIAVNPAVAAAHNNRGVALNALGRHEDALASFERAAALSPDYFDAWHNRANTLVDLGRFEDAALGYGHAITLRPDVSDLFLKRGHALALLNRLMPAIASYDGAIACAPNDRDAHFHRAIALARSGRFDEAVAGYDKVIALNPNDASAFSNRGAALKALRRFDDALASYDRAITLDPALAAAYSNRGPALKELNRLDEALASCDTAIRLMPGSSEAVSNRANVLAALGRFDEAISGYAAAVALNSGDATARLNGGMIKLLTGRFAEGWRDYEARWQAGPMAAARHRFSRPQWTGDIDLAGKRVLLLAEQGFGDTIMAARYVRQVVDRGAHVIVEVARPLTALMEQIDGIRVVTQGDALPDFDLYCPMMSLPLAFGTGRDTIPAEVPYLRAPPAHLERWRPRLPQTSALRVGLNWAGNENFQHDAARSIGLPRMRPLLARSDVQFFALQKELHAGDADILRGEPRLLWLGEQIETFADTAAIVSHLDLVVSSDTSIVHLAGALGRPVWVLLQRVPDWRWLLDREESPWYPTARLFRQTVRNDWTDVIARVSAELGRLASAREPGARPADGAAHTV